jgi:hypothetical protein
MGYDLMDTGFVEDGEPFNVAADIPAERFSPASPLSNPLCCEMGLPELAAQCLRELDHYRRGEPCTEAYGLELLHRAIIQSDQEAWISVQHCFGGMIRGWLHRHPQREMACRLESEEHYVALTFERFWQAAVHTQEGAICSLEVALRYVRASLNGALLETLRAYSGPGESAISHTHEAEERLIQKKGTGIEVWAFIQDSIHNASEQRLAFLLFHCGLSPREILKYCSREFDDLLEISHLRYNILEHLLRRTDKFPLQLTADGMSEQVDDEGGGEVRERME